MKISVYAIILICIALGISYASAAITYKSSVDYDYGFYKVIGVEQKPANNTESSSLNYPAVNYTNKTLTINVGDTVQWINYDQKDWPLTIISEQGLWSETNSRLKYSYQKFNYTFTKPGTFNVYIKERDKYWQNIIVNPTETPIGDNIVKTPEPTVTPMPIPTNTTQIVITPEKTQGNMVPGFEAISFIVAIMLILFFYKKIS